MQELHDTSKDSNSMKICVKCKLHKPKITHFSKDRNSPDGFCYFCKACAAERRAAYRDKVAGTTPISGSAIFITPPLNIEPTPQHPPPGTEVHTNRLTDSSMTIRCKACDERKKLNQFYGVITYRGKPNGWTGICRECRETAGMTDCELKSVVPEVNKSMPITIESVTRVQDLATLKASLKSMLEIITNLEQKESN